MALIEVISIVLSTIVIVVAGFTAIINYLNYKAITSFTIYLRIETKEKAVDQTVSSSPLPRSRVSDLLHSNAGSPSNSLNYPIKVRWFDVILCNCGPGVAKGIEWEVENEMNSAEEKREMHSDRPFSLGPQSSLRIVGYLPRDYSFNFDPDKFSPFTGLQNKTKSFPWVVLVSYSTRKFLRKELKFLEKFEISEKEPTEGTLISNNKIFSPLKIDKGRIR